VWTFHNGFQLELADDLLPLVEETIIVNNLNSIFELRFGQEMNISLGIASFTKNLPNFPNGTKQCTNDPIEKCPWQCRYAMIANESMCNCTPTTYPLLSPPAPRGLKECNLNDYDRAPQYTTADYNF